jgi:ribosome recycling factor
VSTLDIRTETEQRMQKVIESLKKDLSRIRTGRATPALLDGLSVDYYGSPVPINQVANISVPDARMVVIQPWEKSMISAVE